MLFSTDPSPAKSKTKCMFFSRDKTKEEIMQVKLNGDMLPLVNTAKHLGKTRLYEAGWSREQRARRRQVMQQGARLRQEMGAGRSGTGRGKGWEGCKGLWGGCGGAEGREGRWRVVEGCRGLRGCRGR